MKGSEKQLSSKGSFCRFLQLNCSNVRLKQCQKPQSYKIVKENNFEGVCDELGEKRFSRDNQLQNI